MRQWTGSALFQRKAITWTNAGLLSIGLLGTNFSEIRIANLTFSFKKMHLKLSSAKMATICPGRDELNTSKCRASLASGGLNGRKSMGSRPVYFQVARSLSVYATTVVVTWMLCSYYVWVVHNIIHFVFHNWKYRQISCRRCSNYIFILELIHGFNRLGKDNCKTRRETSKFWDLVPLILEIWW